MLSFESAADAFGEGAAGGVGACLHSGQSRSLWFSEHFHQLIFGPGVFPCTMLLTANLGMHHMKLWHKAYFLSGGGVESQADR